MDWGEVSEEQRAAVFQVLEREAERIERDATQLQVAAQRLGRPSLIDHHEMRANAFRAALAALGRR